MVKAKEEKIRIHKIAKDLNLDSKEVIKILSELGHKVTSASSSVPASVVDKIREKLAPPQPARSRIILRKGTQHVEEKPVMETEITPAVETKPEAEEQRMEEGEQIAEHPSTGSQPVEEPVINNIEPVQNETHPAEEVFKKEIEPGPAGSVGETVPPKKTEIIPLDKFKEKKPLRRKIVKKRDEIKVLKEELDDGISEDEIIFEEHIKKKRMPLQRPLKKTEITIPKASKKIIKIEEKIIVNELAQKMGVKASEVIKKLINLGIMANIMQTIDADTASIIASEFGYEVEKNVFNVEEFLKEPQDDPAKLVPRPPVVTVMGHVDHGKTTLLDAIRETNVAEGEAGGITQHIGASEVVVKGKKIVFIDTPGHEAFTQMRARGAQVTDIVILVVAADDGVMPQTVEAINHAKAAKVPIIVAVNKIDKPNVNVHLVKQALAEYGLSPESWGGDTLYAEVSAKKKTGIKELLDLILLQAEMLELKANPYCPARGIIIESKLDRGRGPVSTVLIKKGTLKTGAIVIAGQNSGKIRTMLDFRGNRINEAGPSTPVEIMGLTGVSSPGDRLYEVPDEETAERIANYFKNKLSGSETEKSIRYSLDDLLKQKEGNQKLTLNLIIKADVIGSAEALKNALLKLGTEKIECNVLHIGVGGITESDCLLASASKAIVIGFGVRAEPKAREVAQAERVEIRLYNIIYDAIEDVKKAMEGMLKPIVQEKVLGKLIVRQTFKISKVGTIAGSYVTDGKISAGAKARIIRDNKVIYDSRISSLKRFKDDVKEVSSGVECGVSIENFQDIKVGDIIEAYEIEKTADRL
jgi:translation initiation factor IF-2